MNPIHEKWRVGRPGTVISDVKQRASDDLRDLDYYGGYLVAESIPTTEKALVLAASIDGLQALREVAGNCYQLNPLRSAPTCVFCEVTVGLPHDVDCTMHFVLGAIAKAEGRS